MKINSNNRSIYAGTEERTVRVERLMKEEKENQFNGKSIKAKDLRFIPDAIADKKLAAQKKAWKIITDVNKEEGAFDEHLANMEKRIEDLKATSQKTLEEINQIHEGISNLQKEYHVSDDSQEQKDLELLMKQQEMLQGGMGVTISEEEAKRLANMGELTDYQTRALGLSESLHTKKQEIDQYNNEIQGTTQAISAAIVEHGKSHAMVDATEEADQILKAASKEAINDLLEEGKDQMDETIDQKKEEAEKRADEKKAEEEKKKKAEEIKENHAAQTGSGTKNRSTDTTLTGNSMDVSLATDVENVQQKITNILKEEKLLEEDLKGIAVDTNL